MECSKKILVVGDIMLDSYKFGKVERISPEAPVPVFNDIDKSKDVLGGAANVAVNITAIDIGVDIFSVIGNDSIGTKLIELIKKYNIGTDDICVLDKRKTTHKLRYIGPNNQQILRVDTEQTDEVAYEFVKCQLESISKRINDYGLILVSDYCKGFLTKEITQKIIQLGNDNNVPVFIDVKDPKYEKYEYATLLKPNKKELKLLTGLQVNTKKDVISAASMLCHNTSSQYVLTTLGADGMILADKNGMIKEVKSFAKEVFDVTGAGDTSIAYLAAEVLLGESIENAMVISNYAAGVQVSKVGTSIVYPYEIKAAMNKTFGINKVKKLNYYIENGLSEIEKLKNLKKKIIFTNGCFDVIHAGHIAYLKEARSLGDILVVGLNTDASVKRLKGEKRPINSLEDRIAVLSALECVDYVVPFEEDTPKDLICKIEPNVLVKGGDYTIESVVGADYVLEHGGDVEILPFLEGRSSTKVINLMENI